MKSNTAITYISLDSVREGVGASQVLAYIEKLRVDHDVTLVSFEKITPTNEQVNNLQLKGIIWKPISFGRYGTIGGAQRFIKLLRTIPRKGTVHARSDLAAFASIIVNRNNVIWDCRALLADQRRAILGWQKFSFKFILMRLVEFILAKRSARIIVITESVIPILMKRYKLDISKITHITTCVDRSRFLMTPMSRSPVVALISGTLSNAYDINLMNLIIQELRNQCALKVIVSLGEGHSHNWETIEYDEVIRKSYYEMPNVIAQSSFGLSIWKKNLGVALTSVASTKSAEFLSCGRPLIVNRNQGDIGRIVEDERVGVATVGDSQQEVNFYCREILELINSSDIENRCSSIAERYFDLDHGVKLLSGVYEDLAKL
jgi:hypothetical protein